MRYLFTWCRDFNATCRKYSSCEWALLEGFSRWDVRGQCHDQTSWPIMVTAYISTVWNQGSLFKNYFEKSLTVKHVKHALVLYWYTSCSLMLILPHQHSKALHAVSAATYVLMCVCMCVLTDYVSFIRMMCLWKLTTCSVEVWKDQWMGNDGGKFMKWKNNGNVMKRLISRKIHMFWISFLGLD